MSRGIFQENILCRLAGSRKEARDYLLACVRVSWPRAGCPQDSRQAAGATVESDRYLPAQGRLDELVGLRLTRDERLRPLPCPGGRLPDRSLLSRGLRH